ncbi:PRTase-like protein [Fomitiporia mediterranea MF3/22]|uniref:PRTase-like protein n=1 Tax=Fomitiporia mediterranea (strain MF3/22) TaxID=694068 RepID=UPI0004407AF2|nr:PRTase-like protein [Fomitiporia mediterranea MF3/22]EJD07392.1 PRTase-like protein [Fomitiporia mediterranea MF3/22]
MGETEHLHVTYNGVHNIIKGASKKIAEWKPTLLVAIDNRAYSGFFPARVLRTFLKDPETKKNIPIFAIGLSLYESLPGTTAEQVGNEVIRTQWLGSEGAQVLLGRRVLIVDEIDDTRKTLHYAIKELKADAEKELLALPEDQRDAARPDFAVFVVHNKLKEKAAELPADLPYFPGDEVPDVWLDYPWESVDIEEHDRLAALDKLKAKKTA